MDKFSGMRIYGKDEDKEGPTHFSELQIWQALYF